MSVENEIIGHFRALGRVTNALIEVEAQRDELQQQVLRLTKERDALLEEINEHDKESDGHP